MEIQVGDIASELKDRNPEDLLPEVTWNPAAMLKNMV